MPSTPTASVASGSMAITFENVGIAVSDLEATISFFTDLGLEVVGRDTVRGEWTDTAVGLDGNHAKIAMLQTPDGQGRLELFEYIHPEAITSNPTLPNEIGMHPARVPSVARRGDLPRPLQVDVSAGSERHPGDAR